VRGVSCGGGEAGDEGVGFLAGGCAGTICWDAQIQNQPCVARIGLLFSNGAGTNLSCVSHPRLVTELGQYPLEPLNRSGRFDPHDHLFPQTAIERIRFASGVFEPPLDHFSTDAVALFHHGDLLIARMKITTYN
jgi:hypothetical protein